MTTITTTGILKTYEAWDSDLGTYLQVGDRIDDRLFDHALEVLPPACWRSDLLQIGEAHDHGGDNNRARFTTFQKHDGQWIYTGPQEHGVRVEVTALELCQRCGDKPKKEKWDYCIDCIVCHSDDLLGVTQ